MASTTSREGVLITSGYKSEEEEVGNNVIGPTYHLKGHHLMNNARGQHLNAVVIAMKQFSLKVGQRKSEASIKSLQINTHLSGWRRSDHIVGCRKLYSVSRRMVVRFLESSKLGGARNHTHGGSHKEDTKENEKKEKEKEEGEILGKPFPQVIGEKGGIFENP